jgi:hypothetical protein
MKDKVIKKPKGFPFETVLNNVAQRYQLTRPTKVGSTSKIINDYDPKSFDDWVEIFFEKSVQHKKGGVKVTKEFLSNVGDELFKNLQEKYFPEIIKAQKEITPELCQQFIYDVVLRRTWDGYLAEKSVIEQLVISLNGKVEFNKTDPKLESINIDYVGDIKSKIRKIGISVKPISYKNKVDSIYNSWKDWESENGKVFLVFYKTKKDRSGKLKEFIDNLNVINEIESFITSI